jgi:predicted DsbA family dithiol-disulfide isomerase
MDLFRYADELGLDMAAFEQAFRSAAVANRVRDDMIDAETMDVHKTPTFFINGRRHVGRWDSATLIRELERTELPLPPTERGRPLRDGPR